MRKQQSILCKRIDHILFPPEIIALFELGDEDICPEDEEEINRIFRRSTLYRTKWNERLGEETYGERTIKKAIADQPNYYQHPKNHQAGADDSQSSLRIKDGRIVKIRQTREGPVVDPLCNFTAEIREEVIVDDGAEETRVRNFRATR